MPRKYRRLAYHDSAIIDPATEDAYALADQYVPQYQRAWLAGIREVGDVIADTVRNALMAYYETIAAVTAIESSPEVAAAWRDMATSLDDVMVDLWGSTVDQTHANVMESMIRKSEPDPEMLWGRPELTSAAIDYAENRSGLLIKPHATFEQKSEIRRLAASGIEAGKHPDVIAREIKKTGIGLTKKGPFTYGRVERYRHEQEKAGVKGDVLERRVRAFYDQMLRKRAEMIARTEMIKSMAVARRATWAEDIKTGLIDNRSVRVWISGIGERTCNFCMGLSGETAPIGGEYESGVDGPPRHPQCRCTEIIRIY